MALIIDWEILFKLYSQVYDFNDTKVKVGGELKLTDNLSLLGEQTDVRNGNKNKYLCRIAQLFLKRFDFWVIKKYIFSYTD